MLCSYNFRFINRYRQIVAIHPLFWNPFEFARCGVHSDTDTSHEIDRLARFELLHIVSGELRSFPFTAFACTHTIILFLLVIHQFVRWLRHLALWRFLQSWTQNCTSGISKTLDQSRGNHPSCLIQCSQPNAASKGHKHYLEWLQQEPLVVSTCNWRRHNALSVALNSKMHWDRSQILKPWSLLLLSFYLLVGQESFRYSVWLGAAQQQFCVMPSFGY